MLYEFSSGVEVGVFCHIMDKVVRLLEDQMYVSGNAEGVEYLAQRAWELSRDAELQLAGTMEESPEAGLTPASEWKIAQAVEDLACQTWFDVQPEGWLEEAQAWEEHQLALSGEC